MPCLSIGLISRTRLAGRFSGILFLLASVAIGCGTSLGPTYTQSAPPSDGGRLTFYRPKAFSASATDATLGIEQCRRQGGVVRLANGSFTTYDAAPGKVIVIGGVFAMTDKETIEVAKGEEIFFRVKLGGFPLKIIKSRVSKSEALSELKTLREAPVDPAVSSDDSC